MTSQVKPIAEGGDNVPPVLENEFEEEETFESVLGRSHKVQFGGSGYQQWKNLAHRLFRISAFDWLLNR